MSTTQEYYYKITDLHDLANRESQYALDNADTEIGQALTDKNVLGADEADFFKRMLKTACVVVYKRIHRRGRGVENSYQFDVERESVPGFVIFTLSFPDNFPSDMITPIDTYILDALVFHVLKQWFSKPRRSYLSKDFEDRYMDTIDELKSAIEMRTQIARSSYLWGKYYTEDERGTLT